MTYHRISDSHPELKTPTYHGIFAFRQSVTDVHPDVWCMLYTCVCLSRVKAEKLRRVLHLVFQIVRRCVSSAIRYRVSCPSKSTCGAVW